MNIYAILLHLKVVRRNTVQTVLKDIDKEIKHV